MIPGKIKIAVHIFFLLLSIRAASGVVYAYGPEKSEEEPAGYNVILMVVNALRADHLGCYGYWRNTSPNIDRLSAESFLFERAIASSYWTLSSLASIMTSKFVCGHNVISRQDRLGPDQKTLAKVLKERGYLTRAFTCGLDTSPVYSLDKGFDTYESYNAEKPVGSFSDIMPGILETLKRDKDKKFFLFLQSYDVHPPYKYDGQDSFDKDYEGIFKGMVLDYNVLKQIRDGVFYSGGRHIQLSEEDLNHIVARYDDGIRYADKFIGVLIDKLKELKLYDKTIIILCADHGEELGERGTFSRFGNRNLYQEVIRVPLIIRHPAVLSKGARIRQLAGTVDIMPTVLDFLGIPYGGLDIQGLSLAGMIITDIGASARDFLVSEAAGDKWALVWQDGWKLLHSPEGDELYNIDEDPKESNNVYEKNIDMRVLFLQKFFLWREHHRNENDEKNKAVLTSEMIESLRKAGYW